MRADWEFWDDGLGDCGFLVLVDRVNFPRDEKDRPAGWGEGALSPRTKADLEQAALDGEVVAVHYSQQEPDPSSYPPDQRHGLTIGVLVDEVPEADPTERGTVELLRDQPLHLPTGRLVCTSSFLFPRWEELEVPPGAYAATVLAHDLAVRRRAFGEMVAEDTLELARQTEAREERVMELVVVLSALGALALSQAVLDLGCFGTGATILALVILAGWGAAGAWRVYLGARPRRAQAVEAVSEAWDEATRRYPALVFALRRTVEGEELAPELPRRRVELVF